MSNLVPFKMLSSVIQLDCSLEGWPLLDVPENPDEHRVHRVPVAFESAFVQPPLVQVALVGLDMSNKDNLRLKLRATEITPQGFTVEAETWLNTKIWSLDISWLAIGT